MKIEKIHLELFKGFKNFEVECSQITTLVGSNSCGKTSILQAIQLTLDNFQYAFGKHADSQILTLNNILWNQNPQTAINKLGLAETKSLWLKNETKNPCKLSITFSENIELKLNITGISTYQLDVFIDGNSLKPKSVEELEQAEIFQKIEKIFNLNAQYLPSIAGISGKEVFMPYMVFKQKLDNGSTVECYRNILHWLYNDNKEQFENVAETVEKYLPGVTIKPPKLSHNNPSEVLIEFSEDGVDFDISTSGSGLRTILSLAFTLHVAKSKTLLIDEPDSHLHSSLQKQVA